MRRGLLVVLLPAPNPLTTVFPKQCRSSWGPGSTAAGDCEVQKLCCDESLFRLLKILTLPCPVCSRCPCPFAPSSLCASAAQCWSAEPRLGRQDRATQNLLHQLLEEPHLTPPRCCVRLAKQRVELTSEGAEGWPPFLLKLQG